MATAILDSMVKPGMVYTGGSGGKNQYVVLEVRPDEVLSERVTERDGGSNRHSSGYGWFEKGSFEFVRQMRPAELKQYAQNLSRQ
jgi:hypothetical protein